MTVTHFPVTSTFWRGAITTRPLDRHLWAACTHTLVDRRDTSFSNPTCEACQAFRSELIRMGYLQYGRFPFPKKPSQKNSLEEFLKARDVKIAQLLQVVGDPDPGTVL